MKRFTMRSPKLFSLAGRMSLSALTVLFLYSLIYFLGCNYPGTLKGGVFKPLRGPHRGCLGSHYSYDFNWWFSRYELIPPLKYDITALWRDGTQIKSNDPNQPFTTKDFKSSLENDGLSFDAKNGIISGVPQDAGEWKITVRVTDSAKSPEKPAMATEKFTFEFDDFAIITSLVPRTCLNDPLNIQVDICGVYEPFEWKIVYKSWDPAPAGYTQNLTFDKPFEFAKPQTWTERYNTISVTPTQLAAGSDENGETRTITSYRFTVVVIDNRNVAVSTDVYMEIHEELTILTPQKLKNGFVSVLYDEKLEACGGTPPYKWYLEDGDLPPGLPGLPVDGHLKFIPTIAGDYGFLAEVKDKLNRETYPRQNFNMRIFNQKLKLNVTKPSPFKLDECQAKLNFPLAPHVGLSGGMGTPTWLLHPNDKDKLPPLMQLKSTGELEGRPTLADTYKFRVQVFDATVDPNEPPEPTFQFDVEGPDDKNIVIERFRHGPLGQYNDNEIVFDDPSSPPEVSVVFKFTGPSVETYWNGLQAAQRQAKLKIIGICDEITAQKLTKSGSNYEARFSLTQIKNLVNKLTTEADTYGFPDLKKQPFKFRLIGSSPEAVTPQNKEGVLFIGTSPDIKVRN